MTKFTRSIRLALFSTFTTLGLLAATVAPAAAQGMCHYQYQWVCNGWGYCAWRYVWVCF